MDLLVQIGSGHVDPGQDGEYITGAPPDFNLNFPTIYAGDLFSQEVALTSDPGSGGSGAVNWGDGTGNQPFSLHGPTFGMVNGQLAIVGPSGFHLSHTYASTGEYDVTVVVETAGGSRAKTKTVSVSYEPFEMRDVAFPTTSWSDSTSTFSFRAPLTGIPGYTVTWTFDDANTEGQTATVAPGDRVTFTRTWDAPGTRTVRVTLRNAVGQESSAERVVTVKPGLRVRDLDIPSESFAQDALNFRYTAESTNGGAFVVSHELYEGPIAEENLRAQEGFFTEAGTVDVSGSFTDQVATFDEGETFHIVIKVAGIGYWSVRKVVEVKIVANPNLACDVGTYWDGSGCAPAPAGHYVADAGSQAATPCAPGTFSGVTGAASCETAPAGSFVSGAGASEATLCAPGTYSSASGAVACEAAPAGSFAAGPGATSAEPCAMGTFAANAGQAACDPAPLGSFVDVTGAAEATPCAAGTFSSVAGATACQEAPAGSFVSGVGASEATLCAPGTYSSASGAVACEAAPAGSFAAGPGATEAEYCAPGTYAANAGQSACDPAPLGSFVDVAGATQATSCAAGTFSSVAGATACQEAPAGSFVSGAGASEATLCAPGTFSSTAGATACQAAEPGHFVPVSGATEQTTCAVGSFQPGFGQTSCIPAPMDSYVDVNGATAPTACATGTGTLDIGSTSSADCIKLGEITITRIDGALQSGALQPMSASRGAQQQLDKWTSDVKRSVRFLDGNQHQAGCVGVSNAIAKADGRPSPTDVVRGPARQEIQGLLQRTYDKSGCSRGR